MFSQTSITFGDLEFHTRETVEHYDDVTMSGMASQISSLTIVYSTVYPGADQRKHQSPASLAFVRGIHRRPVNSPHKWPVTRKMFPFDDVIMISLPMNVWVAWVSCYMLQKSMTCDYLSCQTSTVAHSAQGFAYLCRAWIISANTSTNVPLIHGCKVKMTAIWHFHTDLVYDNCCSFDSNFTETYSQVSDE